MILKKYIVMTTIAAVSLFAAMACGDDDKEDTPGGDSGTEVTLKAPPYKDVAAVLNITKSNAYGIKQLRMMESGAYMITYESGSGARVTRAGGDPTYEFGQYTYSNSVFSFDNGMTISYTPSGQGCTVTIKWKNGTTIETTGTIDTSDAVTGGVMTDNLCSRPWTVEKLQVMAPVNEVKVGKVFTAPIDLHEIKVWYEDNYGKLKDQFNDNTIILGIYFDSKGLFSINYQNRDSDVGLWRWYEINKGDFVYSWNDKQKAISLFSGSASVSFQKSPEKCILTLKGLVNGTPLEFEFTMR